MFFNLDCTLYYDLTVHQEINLVLLNNATSFIGLTSGGDCIRPPTDERTLIPFPRQNRALKQN